MERRKSVASVAIRVVLTTLMVAFFGFEAYRLFEGIARHGSVGAYVEAREKAHRLETAVELINRYYVDGPDLEADAVTEQVLESIVSGLDPYSAYLSAEEFKQLEEEAKQQFGGIGIRVEMREGRLTIVAPMEGTPGARAGLSRGDQIVAVDGESIEGRPMGETLSQLRGVPGSEARLTIFRPDSAERFDAEVIRELIEVDNVRDARFVEDGIGYLRLLKFGARTAEEMIEQIQQLQEQGMEGLILDLRNNPGGLLEEAVEVVAPFLEPGQLVVYTEGRRGQTEQWEVDRQTAHFDFPMVVLVNPGSASASEIVAGALKDWGRARLIGERTFGKGSVQSVIALGSDAALSLTTAKYYTPGGYVIHGNGVEPDDEVTLSMDEERQLALQRMQLEFMDEDEFVEEFGSELIPDRQLDAALHWLRQKREE